jgi:putative ABC transport system permease protein
MLKNYLLTAWRNLRRNPFYSTINIAGLGIGLAVGLLILLWAQDELSYDGFHQNAPDIYRVVSHLGKKADEQIWQGSPGPLYQFARTSIPDVANAVRVFQRNNRFKVRYANKTFIESSSAFVDSTFFQVFSFHLQEGKPDNLFTNSNSVVITSSLAKKYFGDNDPIGKVLTFDSADNFTVSGVMADFPDNSSIRYDILFPMSLWAHIFTGFGGNGSWKTIDEDLGNYFYENYIQLHAHSRPEPAEKLLTRIYDEKHPDANTAFTLQPLKSIHLTTADGNSSALRIVRIFLGIAVLILLIAGINYVNLSTARAMLRSKEVGIRKIIGAGRPQLFAQFILESALLFGLASLLAILLIYSILPLYNQIAGKHLFLDWHNPTVWLLIAVTIVATMAAAAVYPATLLSAFHPIQVLKGKFSSLGISNAAFRKVLVVVQFTFSVGLIAATFVIGKQLRYIREKDLGFDKTQVFTCDLNEQMHNHFPSIRAGLLQKPGIHGVASMSSPLAGNSNTTGDTWWEGKAANRTFIVTGNGIDKDFIPMLKMKLVAGSNFTGSKADSTHLILNETAVRSAGIKDPIGKKFDLWQIKGTIIGVVKDFNFASLHEAVTPAVFYYEEPGWRLYIKTSGADAAKAVAAVGEVWKQYSPNLPFEYSFLDDDFAKMYDADRRTGTLFQVFAIVAIIISCLGLFGLATYTAQIRLKEIGIRRVLGATIPQVTGLLARDFVLLVGIALLIATPLTWWSMEKWLQNYVYRIPISPWPFVLTGTVVLTLALLTVCAQAIRAALTNPIQSLRSE